MRYSLALVLTAVLITACHKDVTTPTPSGRATMISEKEAEKHVGENIVVSGTVSGFFVSSQTTNVYLYLDSSDMFHPDFAIVWPGTNDPPTEELRSLILNQKSISVGGKIILETNIPEIIVSSWDQITIH